MAPGRIVIVNGVPRAGKSSIVRAVQHSLPGQWINLGVDVLIEATPEALRPGIGLRPGGERPDLEPFVVKAYAALYESIAAHARMGLDVITDVGHHDFYSKPLHILPDCARRLSGLPVLFVGLDCPIDVIMRRRNADPEGYVAGEGVPAPVRRWQDEVHKPGIYDLRLDTAVMSPRRVVEAIAAALADPPSPSAFEQLAAL
ncbi:MAG TPA: chloramphenicol phosphotransferase [Devosiaceae bacterium]|jgi:chloramphenicol 3-O phosphotransferase